MDAEKAAKAAAAVWPKEVTTVYVVCHPIKEKARWERLLPHLLERGVPLDRIRPFAPTWGADLTAETIFKFYDPYLDRSPLPTFTFKGACLSRGEISLYLNFVGCILDATEESAGSDDDIILILESDVWLRVDFVERLKEVLAAAKAEAAGAPWDYISLGEGIGTRPKEVVAFSSYYAPTKLYPPPHKFVFRCTDSMLFTRAYLKRLSQTALPFKEAADWEMNYQMMLHGGKAYWADPPLAEQGTCFNRMITSLPC
jgi:hypothetical protein